MGRAFGPHPAGSGEVVTTPTKVAALLGPGDHIGYEGQWRTVKATKPSPPTKRGAQWRRERLTAVDRLLASGDDFVRG
jgi:hypothetical protein